MPTYEYECPDCGYEFEKFQSMTARSVKKCPKCAKRKVKRLIGTGAGIIFKGSGFYQTDYRGEAYRKAAEKDKPPSEKSDSKSDKKTEKQDTSSKKEVKSKASGDSAKKKKTK